MTAQGNGSAWATYFGDDAQSLAQQLVKGTDVYVGGLLKMSTWTAQDGTPRNGLNATAWRLEPLGQIGKRAPARAAAARRSTEQRFCRDAFAQKRTGQGIARPADVDDGAGWDLIGARGGEQSSVSKRQLSRTAEY
ncbi:MAG: single-stranded DNA-binding protein [Chloroflexi bacterium]|nr:single-stranded DNA-binding protein [Chloroflexota bacterium]